MNDKPAADEPMDEDKRAEYCAVEVSELEALTWVAQLEQEEEEEEVEIGESFPQLDPQNVAEARAEELAYVQRRGLWTVVPVPEVVVPVSVRWIDVLKAEGITRSRLVGLQGERLGAR